MGDGGGNYNPGSQLSPSDMAQMQPSATSQFGYWG
jgi:hypothetical protein